MQSRLFVCIFAATALLAQEKKFPPLKRQPNAAAVVKEHLSAINACDWNRLMAQYPADVEIFYPDGVLAKGRAAVGDKFAEAVKPFAQGGLCGLHFIAEHTQVAGNTLNVQWRAEAPFLAEPYRGADAYETRNGLMQAQVTTFKSADIRKK
ncbi:MAG TPA: nuclear transport factor 2 family protein [Bryobacteraceae bacterium]|jgi:hypothetical protein|nr:nuclear transport factor 2 family protein [Bryobacteraceae bacterium]